jgi:hypothetical protein
MKICSNRFVVSIILSGFVLFSYSQTNTNPEKTFFGVSSQFYPAGIIATINAEHFISENTSLVYRLGGNFVDRQDFSSENDNEKGAGFGGSFGFRKHFPLKKGNIIAGLNIDAWNLWIDWKNDMGLLNQTYGTTYTLVLQPWIEAGYFFYLKNTSSQLGVIAALGREINAITNGKDVAQDWIASLTIQYQFTL